MTDALHRSYKVRGKTSIGDLQLEMIEDFPPVVYSTRVDDDDMIPQDSFTVLPVWAMREIAEFYERMQPPFPGGIGPD